MPEGDLVGAGEEAGSARDGLLKSEPLGADGCEGGETCAGGAGGGKEAVGKKFPFNCTCDDVSGAGACGCDEVVDGF